MTVPLQNSVRGNLVYMWGGELCEQLRVTCQFQLVGCHLVVVSCRDGVSKQYRQIVDRRGKWALK